MKRIEKRLQLLEEYVFRDKRQVIYLFDLRDLIAFDEIYKRKEHKDYRVFYGEKVEPFMDIFFSEE